VLEFTTCLGLILAGYLLGVLDGLPSREGSLTEKKSKPKPLRSDNKFENYSHLRAVAAKIKAKKARDPVKVPLVYTHISEKCDKVYDAEVVDGEIKIKNIG
tara:strand:+ start:1263 stop:1565 length:303 start_codon:yes stop_codon:yes gene_type:complete